MLVSVFVDPVPLKTAEQVRDLCQSHLHFGLVGLGVELEDLKDDVVAIKDGDAKLRFQKQSLGRPQSTINLERERANK